MQLITGLGISAFLYTNFTFQDEGIYFEGWMVVIKNKNAIQDQLNGIF